MVTSCTVQQRKSLKIFLTVTHHRTEAVYEEISNWSEETDEFSSEYTNQSKGLAGKCENNIPPTERKADYNNIPQSDGYNEAVCCHGYEEAKARTKDEGGYERPLQDMVCITYKVSKPPTPESSTLTICETRHQLL